MTSFAYFLIVKVSDTFIPIYQAKDICLQRRTRRCFGLVLRNAERQERFAVGANLFRFEEGICPELVFVG